jgi:hypothetical protein
MGYDPSKYEQVSDRLRRFWRDHPEARIWTEMVFQDERRFIVRAEIYFDVDDVHPKASGYAEEIVGASPVNRTSALENCETSAIGRALANCNYVSEGKERASAEEMQKVERYKAEPRKPSKKQPSYTAEQLAQAEAAMDTVGALTDVDALRDLWMDHTDVLDAPVRGTCLKDAINARVEDLKS